MNNQTLHWLGVVGTAAVGFIQWATPFIPPTYTPIALGVVAGIHGLLHAFFPANVDTPQ